MIWRDRPVAPCLSHPVPDGAPEANLLDIMVHLDNLLLGLISSAIISVTAYQRGSLSESGIIGAVIVGTLIFGFGGWVWGLTLITFFVASSALSHYRVKSLEDSSESVSDYKASVKERLAEKFAKGHRRDIGQTLANGGLGAMMAVAYAIWGQAIFFAAFLGAMAAVNADTWATELGVLNPSPPRLITNGRVVEVGTSGGISRLGMVASAGGALAIGLGALTFTLIGELLSKESPPWDYAWVIPAALVGGLGGSLLDSLLGASIQAIFFCPTCAKETEKRLHGCGTPTHRHRGWRWLNNDMVNFISSIVGALAATAVFLLI